MPNPALDTQANQSGIAVRYEPDAAGEEKYPLYVVSNNPTQIIRYSHNGTSQIGSTITLSGGFDDTEAIFRIRDNDENPANDRFAIVEEKIGYIHLIDITSTTTDIARLQQDGPDRFPLNPNRTNWSNNGIEGVAFDGSSFLVVKESGTGSGLYVVSPTGQTSSSPITVTGFPTSNQDFSDIYYANGHAFITTGIQINSNTVPVGTNKIMKVAFTRDSSGQIVSGAVVEEITYAALGTSLTRAGVTTSEPRLPEGITFTDKGIEMFVVSDTRDEFLRYRLTPEPPRFESMNPMVVEVVGIPGSIVEVLVGNTLSGSGTIGGNGRLSFPLSGVSSANPNIRYRLKEGKGNDLLVSNHSLPLVPDAPKLVSINPTVVQVAGIPGIKVEMLVNGQVVGSEHTIGAGGTVSVTLSGVSSAHPDIRYRFKEGSGANAVISNNSLPFTPEAPKLVSFNPANLQAVVQVVGIPNLTVEMLVNGNVVGSAQTIGTNGRVNVNVTLPNANLPSHDIRYRLREGTAPNVVTSSKSYRLGDVTQDNRLKADDIDAVFAQFSVSNKDNRFNVNGDYFKPENEPEVPVIDIADVNALVQTIMGTRYGDADLDMKVDVFDFEVWNSNKYMSGKSWATGDFTGDKNVDGSDFNKWNENKQTRQQMAAAVPSWQPGDYNFDGVKNALDIDRLFLAKKVYATADTAMRTWLAGVYSLDGDSDVDWGDVYHLVYVNFQTVYGDIDLDHDVDEDDYDILMASYYQYVNSWALGDLNGDGIVNFSDFTILNNNFGWGT